MLYQQESLMLFFQQSDYKLQVSGSSLARIISFIRILWGGFFLQILPYKKKIIQFCDLIFLYNIRKYLIFFKHLCICQKFLVLYLSSYIIDL